MRIAVFGAGGVGGYFGGRLAEAGVPVAFVARGAHLAAIRERGLRVESPAGDFVVTPAVASDRPEELGTVDAVLVAVKAWQVGEAARSMAPLLHRDTFVVPLENGVDAVEILAEALGRERVLGGLCRIFAWIAEPGLVRHGGVAPSLDFGELRGASGGAPGNGGASERTRALADAFAGTRGVTARIAPDVEAAMWEKFLFIASMSGVGALAGTPVGEWRAVPRFRALAEAAMREIAGLAAARGVAIRADAVERALGFVDGLEAGATASMQRDLADGRPSELEEQNGAVVRLADAAGLAVPANRAIYEALLPLETLARAALD